MGTAFQRTLCLIFTLLFLLLFISTGSGDVSNFEPKLSTSSSALRKRHVTPEEQQRLEEIKAKRWELMKLGELFNVTCDICTAGSFSPELECYECEAGHCPPGLCQLCIPGTFSDKDGAEICSNCDKGSYQPREGMTNCTLCPKGQYSDIEGASNCTDCGPGWFSNDEGSTGCQRCNPGHTSIKPYDQCQACPPGSHCTGYGCVECQRCTPGLYQNRQGQEECPPCNYGSFSEEVGAIECTPCGSGRYLPYRGANSSRECLICPTGSYCPDATTERPLACPADAYCPEGSSMPIYCTDLFKPDPENLKCYPSAVLYVIIGVSTLVFVGIIALVIYGRRRSRFEEEVREEASNLLKKQNSGPVYSGL